MPHSVLSRQLDDLPDLLAVPPLPRGHLFDVIVRPPGSKSLTNRAILLAALARGTSTLRRALTEADDARQMVASARTLGARIDEPSPGTLIVEGVCGRWKPGSPEPTLNLNNAGTGVRFLTAAAMLSPTPVVIDGSARMRERPIGELIAALRSMGVTVDELGEPGRPPLRIYPFFPDSPLPVVSFGRTRSGQFISALLLAAPFLPCGLTIRLNEPPTSASYIAMTLAQLSAWGASVQHSEGLRVIRVGPPASDDETDTTAPRPIAGRDETIEPDASGATYFWAAATLFPGSRCRVPGLSPVESLQGDARFASELARMGAAMTHRPGPDPYIEVEGGRTLRPILTDLRDMPDAAMTLAAVAAFAPGGSIIRGVRTLRDKESDRIAAMRTELAKIGVRVDSPVAGDDDVMSVTPPAGGVDCGPDAPPIEFETYDDHRIAMSLALVALRRPNVSMRDPGCVGKTYPSFWQHLALLYPDPRPA